MWNNSRRFTLAIDSHRFYYHYILYRWLILILPELAMFGDTYRDGRISVMSEEKVWFHEENTDCKRQASDPPSLPLQGVVDFVKFVARIYNFFEIFWVFDISNGSICRVSEWLISGVFAYSACEFIVLESSFFRNSHVFIQIFQITWIAPLFNFFTVQLRKVQHYDLFTMYNTINHAKCVL